MSLLAIILAVVFALFGVVIEGAGGFLFGAVLGYCMGMVISLQTSLNDLKWQFKHLERLYHDLKNEFHIRMASDKKPQHNVANEPVSPPAQPQPQDTLPPADTIVPSHPIMSPPVFPNGKTTQTTSGSKPHTPVEPRQPAPPLYQPQEPPQRRFEENFVDKAMAAFYKFFTDGNVVVKIGMLFLIIGIGYLLKYAYDEKLIYISMPLRFIGSGLLGLVLVVFGWRFRHSKRLYALVLQGGGIGVMYLTVFGAAKFYSMIPIEMAFFIMSGLVVFSAMLAVLQDARSLAFFGAIGGFLAPVLLSTGAGNHIVLFSYYTLLNIGILSIAWFKSWRLLNLLGFVFTFVISGLWGANRFTADHFYSTEPFLIVFFLMYVAIAVLYAFRQPPNLKGYIDGTLVFGVPIICFGYQASIAYETFHSGLSVAYSSLAVGAFYIGLASILWQRQQNGMRLLTESFLAMGVVFLSLAIPLALDGRWSSATWAFEGAALVWIGVRQNRVLARLFGLILQAGAGFFFIDSLPHSYPVSSTPVFNGVYIGGVIISLAGLFSSYYLYRHRDSLRAFEIPVHLVLFVWGLAWWFVIGIHETGAHVNHRYAVNAMAGFVFFSLLLCYLLQIRLNWSIMRFVVLSNLYAMMLFLISALDSKHPFADYGILVWTVALLLQYGYLYFYRESISELVLKWQNIMTFWLILLLFSWEGAYAVNKLIAGGHAWRDVMFAFVPAIMMFALFTLAKKINWPFRQNYNWYIELASFPVMMILGLTAAGFSILHAGNAWPVEYIPLINPIDLAVGFLLYLQVLWRLQLRVSRSRLLEFAGNKFFNYTIGGLIFLWLNGMLARTIHHWFDVRYDLDRLLSSDLYQASVSILWTIIALSVMTAASRRLSRPLWFVGLTLFIIVAAKLFLHDIANAGALVMAISITVVGILAVIFGYYLSPLPPQKDEATL